MWRTKEWSSRRQNVRKTTQELTRQQCPAAARGVKASGLKCLLYYKNIRVYTECHYFV